MASSNPLPGSPNTSHPSVHSTVELHTPTTLLASPHLPTLCSLINRSFDHSHNEKGFSYLPRSENARLQTQTQLGEEVGPNGFILIMLQWDTPSSPPPPDAGATSGFISSTGHRIIGTASAKPYHSNHPISSSVESTHATHLFKRPPTSSSQSGADATDTPKWEILAMAVDPSLQGHGLASQLMNLTIDEIKRRCRSSSHSTPSSSLTESASGKVILLISVMKEVYESYYLKRGWTTTATKEIQPGMMGSRDGFSIVEMYMIVDL